jgi:Family of unknown function (DUF5678)
MASMAIDFSELLKDVPKGAWVAISHDRTRMVNYGSDLSDVLNEAKNLGEQDPIVTKVPQSQNALAF